MDSLLRTVGNLLPYHLLGYGALLGTELYQVGHPFPQHGAELTSWVELCQHKDLLSGSSDERIHRTAETTFPCLLCHPGWPDSPDGSDLPAIQYPVTFEKSLERWVSRSSWIDGLSELVRVRPEDDDCRAGKKGTAWYVWLEYVCCWYMVANCFLPSREREYPFQLRLQWV